MPREEGRKILCLVHPKCISSSSRINISTINAFCNADFKIAEPDATEFIFKFVQFQLEKLPPNKQHSVLRYLCDYHGNWAALIPSKEVTFRVGTRVQPRNSIKAKILSIKCKNLVLKNFSCFWEKCIKGKSSEQDSLKLPSINDVILFKFIDSDLTSQGCDFKAIFFPEILTTMCLLNSSTVEVKND